MNALSKLKMKRASLAVVLVFGTGAVYAAQPAGSAAAPSGKAEVLTTSVDHTKAMENLRLAAQRLRETIQALAQQPVGPKRSAAIEASRDALLTTQRAMIDLPADFRVESVRVKEASDWPKAASRLQQAAEKLRESVDAMEKQPSGKGRDAAITNAQKALQDTQQAMLALPEFGSK